MDVYLHPNLSTGGVYMSNKKRINIYVDDEVYQEFKRVCSFTGETITSVIDHAMKEYISAVKMIIEAGDKDKLMAMLQRRLDVQMNSIEKEIDERIKTQK